MVEVWPAFRSTGGDVTECVLVREGRNLFKGRGARAQVLVERIVENTHE